MSAWAATTFASLHTPNYRRYFAGQAVSLVGTWMQTVAQAWLVLELTGSGTALGLVAAAQFLPILLLAPYGGVLADRLDKRTILIATQCALGTMALTLGILTVTGAVRLWMVVVLALALGVVTAIDNPARQAFAQEMVGAGGVRNAVSLNSVLVNTARAVGPAVAGVLIATVGTGACFLINAASYVAVVIALAGMDVGALRPTAPAGRAPGQVRQGLSYVARTPDLLVPLMMLAVVGTLAYEFQVVLPLLARGPLEGGAGTYGLLTSAMGAGAIVGGLVVAQRGRTGLRPSRSRRRSSASPSSRGRRALCRGDAGRPRGRRRHQRHLPLRGEHDPPAGRGTGLPRAGDGPVGRGVPRQHAARRPDHRGRLGAPQPARWARDRRLRLPCRRGLGAIHCRGARGRAAARLGVPGKLN